MSAVRIAGLAAASVALSLASLTVRGAEPPALGPAGAPVTVEVFCDFLCPNCAEARPALRRLVDAHRGRVRFVLRDFPVHPLSGQVAEAAACAGDQGRFWEMRTFLYDRQRRLSEAAVREEAGRLGLDGARFGLCLASRVHAAAWQRDLARGRSLGVSGTPSFLVGSRLLEGFNEAELARAIQKELGRPSPSRKAGGG